MNQFTTKFVGMGVGVAIGAISTKFFNDAIVNKADPATIIALIILFIVLCVIVSFDAPKAN